MKTVSWGQALITKCSEEGAAVNLAVYLVSEGLGGGWSPPNGMVLPLILLPEPI